MALSVVWRWWWLVGGGITFVNEVSGVIQGATTTTDVTLPAGLAEGDVLVFMIAADADLVGTEPTDPVDLDISRDGWFNLFASDSEKWTATSTGWSVAQSRLLRCACAGHASFATPDAPYVCQAWRGVDARVFDARSGSDYTTGSSASPNPPSVTTVTDGALVIAFAMMDDDDTTVSVWPTGYTNQIEKGTGNTGTSNQATIAMSSKIVTTAGSENPSAYTFNSSDAWSTCSIALIPDQSEVSSWVITEVGREIYNSADAGTTYTLPTVLENDYVLVFAVASDGLGTFGTPMNSTGWTELGRSARYRGIWGKVMGATPDTSVDIDDASFPDTTAIIIIAFRGVDTTTPQDVAMSHGSATTTCPAITTATNNALVLRYRQTYNNYSYGISEWPIGYAGFSWSTGGQFGSSSSAFSLCYTQQDTAGSTGTETLRSSDVSGGESSGTMALRPA